MYEILFYTFLRIKLLYEKVNFCRFVVSLKLSSLSGGIFWPVNYSCEINCSFKSSVLYISQQVQSHLDEEHDLLYFMTYELISQSFIKFMNCAFKSIFFIFIKNWWYIKMKRINFRRYFICYEMYLVPLQEEMLPNIWIVSANPILLLVPWNQKWHIIGVYR